MRPLRLVAASAVALSTFGLIVPAPLLHAAPPATAPTAVRPVQPPAKSIADVRLDAAGYLQGMLVDSQGKPVADATVVVAQGKRDLATTRTNRAGRFAVGPLGRGSYLMKSGDQTKAVRVWMPRMAPPSAGEVALFVTGDDVLRGQMPLEDFFASDAFVITGLVAAIIAIPIAVHNSGSKTPSSP